jgi:hypothetical protein
MLLARPARLLHRNRVYVMPATPIETTDRGNLTEAPARASYARFA